MVIPGAWKAQIREELVTLFGVDGSTVFTDMSGFTNWQGKTNGIPEPLAFRWRR